MIYGLIILAVVVGALLGAVWVLWQRLSDLDADWLDTPQPPSRVNAHAKEPRPAPLTPPGPSEAVQVVNAVMEGFAKIYNPPPQQLQIPVAGDAANAEEAMYDPWAAFEQGLTEDLAEHITTNVERGDDPVV